MIPQHILDLLEMRYLQGDPIPKKITTKPRPCPDCGLKTRDRRVDITRSQRGQTSYWRHKCSHCGLSSLDGENWQHPATIERDMRRLK